MIELAIAFGAGLISFLSPCVLPLIPGYVSFISGNTLNEILEKKKIDLLPLIVFSLGFSFVLLSLVQLLLFWVKFFYKILKF